MKKIRMLVAATLLAGGLIVVGAPPASANCEGDPNVCVLICSVGQSNKYTKDLFSFCYVW
jgi:hypothetical protein